jgi:PTS system nitrogen regulatory IIA component
MIKVIPDVIMSDLSVTCKKQALYAMADHVADKYNFGRDDLIYSLLEREKIGSTGVGGGVAIPHAKISGIDRFVGIFAQLKTSINFESFDDQDVDLIYLLLVPENIQDGSHLQALAKISRFFRSPELCQNLRANNAMSESSAFFEAYSA